MSTYVGILRGVRRQGGITAGMSGSGDDTAKQNQSGKNQNEQGSSHVSLPCRTLPMLKYRSRLRKDL